MSRLRTSIIIEGCVVMEAQHRKKTPRMTAITGGDASINLEANVVNATVHHLQSAVRDGLARISKQSDRASVDQMNISKEVEGGAEGTRIAMVEGTVAVRN